MEMTKKTYSSRNMYYEWYLDLIYSLEGHINVITSKI